MENKTKDGGAAADLQGEHDWECMPCRAHEGAWTDSVPNPAVPQVPNSGRVAAAAAAATTTQTNARARTRMRTRAHRRLVGAGF